MTQEPSGGGTRLKNKVKEIDTVVMFYLRARWKWD